MCLIPVRDRLRRGRGDRRLAISERESKSAELDIREDDAIDARWREFVKTHGDLIHNTLREEQDRL